MILSVTCGAIVSTNTVEFCEMLVSPARLVAITCQTWRPWVSATGTWSAVAAVWPTTTPPTLTVYTGDPHSSEAGDQESTGLTRARVLERHRGRDPARRLEQLRGDDLGLGAGPLHPRDRRVAGQVAAGEQALVGVGRAKRGGGDDLLGAEVGPVGGVADADLGPVGTRVLLPGDQRRDGAGGRGHRVGRRLLVGAVRLRGALRRGVVGDRRREHVVRPLAFGGHEPGARTRCSATRG